MCTCVLAPISTLLVGILFHVSVVECTCHQHTSTPCRLATRLQSGPKRWPASQPATEEGPWRSQSSSLMVPINTSGQSMHSRIFWCADHALRGPVACAGPLRASWPGHTERWSLSKIVPRGRQNPGQISELFQNGPNRKNRAKAKMLIQLDLDLVLEFELVLDN